MITTSLTSQNSGFVFSEIHCWFYSIPYDNLDIDAVEDTYPQAQGIYACISGPRFCCKVSL